MYTATVVTLLDVNCGKEPIIKTREQNFLLLGCHQSNSNKFEAMLFIIGLMSSFATHDLF